MSYRRGMVSIGMTPASPRPRASVTLAGLLAQRDASIASQPRATALAVLRAKRALGAARGATVRGLRISIVGAFALLAALLSAGARHGLVLAGLTAWIVAAWWYAPIAGMAVLGAALFFLELRRR